MDDFLSDDDEDSEQPATPAVADLPPVDPEIKPRDFSPVELSLTTFVMRRISCSARATYIIFWVQDRKEESYISVVVRFHDLADRPTWKKVLCLEESFCVSLLRRMQPFQPFTGCVCQYG